MTDKELIEMAAKAASMDTEWHNAADADYDAEHDGMWLKGGRSPDNSKYWNPLTDDGDALRLAVTLGMQIHVNIDPAGFSAIAVLQSTSAGARTFVETDDADRYAATRRAIVRAAAEIGGRVAGGER
jgi:hypothetical protein